MAIEEHDREDLLRDGRTMPVRGEVVAGELTILVGFRSQGQLSLYWGSQRVFQFDEAGRIRRVFFEGRKFAADSGDLLELRRSARGGRVEFTRRQAAESTASTITDAVRQSINQVAEIIVDGKSQWRVVGASEADFLSRVSRWLRKVPLPIEIASSANA